MPPNSAVCETNASATEERSLEMNRQYRQGDVLLCAVEQIPRDARPVMPKSGRVVVAGELTRHAHDFDAEDVCSGRSAGAGAPFCGSPPMPNSSMRNMHRDPRAVHAALVRGALALRARVCD
jgi:hypothetical protein